MLSSAVPADDGISGLRGTVVSIATVQLSGKKSRKAIKPHYLSRVAHVCTWRLSTEGH